MRLRLGLLLVLLTSPAVAGGFRDGITCTVQGHLYLMPGGERPDFVRADSCTGVRWRMDEVNHALILWSPVTVVTVPLPDRTDGQMIFQYRWGNDTAQIGGQPQTVHAEPTVMG
jgi:hypothetical protein